MVFPTISTSNNTLRVNVGGTWKTGTMTTGNYNGTQLAAQIQSVLVGMSFPGLFTASYDTTNLSLTISNSSYGFTIDGTVGYGIALLARPYTGTMGTSTTLFWPFCPAYGADVIYLTSNMFASIDTVGPGGAHDTLFAINVVEPFGAVIDRSMPAELWLPLPSLCTKTLTFELRDRYYNLLSLTPNVSFVMTID
jgi:hypothetical protein